MLAVYKQEAKTYPVLSQMLKDPNSAPVKTALIDCRAGREGGGRDGILKWVSKSDVKKWYWNNLGMAAVAKNSECTEDNAEEALRMVFGSEAQTFPVISQMLRDPNSAPVKAALADCRAGREGGGRDGLRHWLSRPDVKKWYWDNLGMARTAKNSECTGENAERTLFMVFSDEAKANRAVAQIFRDPNSAPVKRAIIDCMAGREGGGLDGMRHWLSRPEVRKWYVDNTGIGQLLAAGTNGVATITTGPSPSLGGVGSRPPIGNPPLAVCDPFKVKTRLPSDGLGVNTKTERCFGAIGSACEDQVTFKKIPLKGSDKDRAVVNKDCTVTVVVSVGSIEHDNCCLRNPDGLHCKGAGPLDMSVDFVDDKKVCAKEWRKATYDVLEGRYWWHTYGPYIGDSAHDPIVPADSRPSRLPGRFGVQDDVTPFHWGETELTRSIQAPSGTPLEIYDVAFCASGQFSSEHWCTAGGTICGDSDQLNAARKRVADWENWAKRKGKECEQYWPVDPRRAACFAEIAAAEPDHLARQAEVARLEGIYNTRNSDWGYCK